MLIDCLTNTRLEGSEKIVWVLVIILLQWLGALIYLLVGRSKQPRDPLDRSLPGGPGRLGEKVLFGSEPTRVDVPAFSGEPCIGRQYAPADACS